MAFRRSAVRSRLAPPPHHRGRAAFAAATPLLLLLRAGLVLALLGLLPASAPRTDPALELARAAGALCQGEVPDGTPTSHSHENCLACPGSAPPAGLAESPAAPVLRHGAMATIAPMGHAVPSVGWAAYSSRAPPGLAV